MRPVLVLPSLLSADFSRLADEIKRCEDAGARRLHVDVMDGHFVPNLTFGPLLVEAMRRSTRLPLDVHLMMSNPGKYLKDFRNAGADALTLHVEAVGQRSLDETMAAVRATGAQLGLAFNPDTDPELWFRFLAQADLAMFMTVYPGFGGQSFIPQVRPRIRATRAAFPQLDIQVDGGINRSTIPTVVTDGANRLVCGVAFFKDADPAGFLRWAEAVRPV